MQRYQHQFLLTTSLPVVASRRSHRKSRAGCFACKKGHIKCSEEKPHCRKCLSRGKVCQYPALACASEGAKDETGEARTSSQAPTTALSTVSAAFTLHDLKLFHHFLCFAYPPLPLGSKRTWTQDIPQLSHQSEHLMSALLGLAAAHINALSATNIDLGAALSHRGRAIAGLREACAKTHHSAADYDTMLATCYSLTFQSPLLPSDAADFATFVKGCAMFTERIQMERTCTVFNNLSRGSITTASQGATEAQLDLDAHPEGSRFKVLLSKGMVSLCAAQACMGNRYRGLSFLINLQSVFSGLQVSPSTGYNRFINYYAVWFNVAQDRNMFSSDSADAESQLLWAFLMALQIFTTLLIDDLCSRPAYHQRPPGLGHPAAARKIIGLMEWLYAIEALAPANLHKHFAWPRLVFDEAISHFDVPMVSEARLQAKIAALCNFPSCSYYVIGDILKLSAGLANWTEDVLAYKSREKGTSAKGSWDTISAQTGIGMLGQDRRISRIEPLHLM